MNILVAATSCHPTAGSEAYVGWQAVSQLRREHDLWVLTSGWCREGIDEFLGNNPEWSNVRFIYVDRPEPCHPNRLVARIQSWTRYRRWCHLAALEGKRLAREVRFDLAHHVTYATWRTGSPLSGLGIPWIWGPIGGGELFPWKLLPVLSPMSAFFEIIRTLNTWVSRRSRAVKEAVATASLILPNNPETERLILELGAPGDRIRRLCQAFLPAERLSLLERKESDSPSEYRELRCIAGGNLEGRKGVSLAIRAIAVLVKSGIPCRYTYLGRGPELHHLKGLVRKLGINDRVSFMESLSGNEYAEALKSHHIFLLPSLREGLGITQMEAMAAGCVPIVAGCGGPGMMAGIAGIQSVDVSDPEAMVGHLALLLKGLWERPEEWKRQSARARKAIIDVYAEENYGARIGDFYNLVKQSSFRKNL